MKGLKELSTVICLLILISGYQIANAQQDLAQQAYTIFETHCIDCHGEFGSYADELVIQHKALIEVRAVIPGKPDASELYTRLLGDTDKGSQMPLGQAPLDSDAIATIRRWIAVGSPDWEAISKPKRHFITTDTMLKTIHTHLTSLTDFDRTYARYFALTHLYNAGARDDNLRAYRNALSKLINSLSWGKRVKKPIPIDPEDTIFYIDLRDYQWDYELDSKSDPWYKIQQAYPYSINFTSSTYKTLCQETDCEVPFVRADWFIATASVPPLYYNILDLPKTDRELEARLEVNVEGNIKNAPGKRVWRAGFNESGVSRNNRVVERHESQHGAYWKSYDFKGNAGKQNIFTYPLDFTHDGGEIIFNLPNGLQAYYLTTASGTRLDAAPIDIVSTGERDPVVRNGISCMGCHTEGIKRFEDQVRPAIVQIPNPVYDKAQALRLYAEKSTMDALIREDIARYRLALEASGGIFGGSEPIQQLVKQFEGPLNAGYAAAEVGLEKDIFLQKVRENRTLQNDASLIVLGNPKRSVKRDAWESQFGKVVFALNLGKHSKPTLTQPTTVPKREITTKHETPTPSRTSYTDMVLILAGDFQMGSNYGDSDEKPAHTVYLDAFYMDKYEVTNAQYKKFVDANRQWQKHHISNVYHDGDYLKDWEGNYYPSGKGNHPVVYVSWYAAMAYAQWANKRLPTEAEWEKAARGRLIGKTYPRGDSIAIGQANYNRSIIGTTRVGKYAASGYGLYDMAGNVSEWCLDEYNSDFYLSSPRRNPTAGVNNVNGVVDSYKVKTQRVLRGGTWSSIAKHMRVADRNRAPADRCSRIYGFRCVNQ